MYHNDTKYYRQELWHHIQKGLLTGKGMPFSFTVKVVTESITYQRWPRDLFPNMWKKKEVRRSSNKKNFHNAYNQLPPTITSSSKIGFFG